MATTLTQILDRVDAILKSNVPTDAQVFRDRAEAESRDEAPCVNVLTPADNVEPFSGEMDRHEVTVELHFNVRAVPPTPAVEELHASVHTAVVTDPVLLALCVSVRHLAATFTPAEADITSLCKTVPYRFIYLISKNTL